MSDLARIETQMRHIGADRGRYESNGDRIITTCKRCNLEVHGYDDWDEDRGNIFIGWFHDGVNSKGNIVGLTHCPDEFIADLKSEYSAILSEFLKK